VSEIVIVSIPVAITLYTRGFKNDPRDRLLLGKSIFDYRGKPVHGREPLRLLARNTVSGHAVMVDRGVVSATIFCSTMIYDWALALVSTFAHGIRYVPEAVTFHRQHGRNQLNQFVGRPGRRRPTRVERTRAFAEPFRILASVAAISADQQRAFNRLADAAETLSEDQLAPYVRYTPFLSACRAALDLVPGDDGERKNLMGKARKLARGNLHPARWWQTLRGR